MKMARKLKGLRLSLVQRQKRDEYLSKFRDDGRGNLVLRDQHAQTIATRSLVLGERTRLINLHAIGREFGLQQSIIDMAGELGMSPAELTRWAVQHR
jgi:hypothetical protein